MHLGEISFCDKVGYNIKCDLVKQSILNDLESFGIKIIQKHYKEITKDTMYILNNNPHLISVRTNGNPYLIYFTRRNNVNQCIFIDKKVQQGYFYPRMILIKIWFSDELFNGTILDGEMVKDNNNKWLFITSDILVHDNEIMTSINLVKRLHVLVHIFKNQYMYDPWVSHCDFQIKKYFEYKLLDHVKNEYIPSLPYTTRGLIFKSLHLKFKDFLLNFDNDLIKSVKRKKYKHTSEFIMNISPDEVEAKIPKSKEKIIKHENLSSYSNNGSSDTKAFYCKKTNVPDVYELEDENNQVSIACVPTLKVSKMLREGMINCNVVEKIVVSCTWNEKFTKWMPIKILS